MELWLLTIKDNPTAGDEIMVDGTKFFFNRFTLQKKAPDTLGLLRQMVIDAGLKAFTLDAQSIVFVFDRVGVECSEYFTSAQNSFVKFTRS